MGLIDNLCIRCVEWDYPVESSRLPADLQWISFVLESALWKILCLVCKMCKTLYNNYKIFPVECVISQATYDTKIKLADNMWQSLLFSCSLSVCFLHNIWIMTKAFWMGLYTVGLIFGGGGDIHGTKIALRLKIFS